MNELFQPGLENVIASETQISYLDVANEEIVLRGYDLIELAQKSDLPGHRLFAVERHLA